MKDVLCTIMGIMDVLAGLLIIFGFWSHILGIILGISMIGKGISSFIG
jgi:uncharacterized membrane protein YphA (DoxX/SURF4 family)